jgi:hypothetical protein
MTNDLAQKRKKQIGIHETLNIAAWNVRSVGKKESELVEEIKTKGINITVISETKKKLKGTKMICNYAMLCSGVSQEIRGQSGIALIIDHKWTSLITNYSFVNDRIITVHLKTKRTITIIRVLFIKSSACSITVSNTTCYCNNTVLLSVFIYICLLE